MKPLSCWSWPDARRSCVHILIHHCNEKIKISAVLKERSSRLREKHSSLLSVLSGSLTCLETAFKCSLHFHTKTTFRERTRLMPTVCTKKLLWKSVLNRRRESTTRLEWKANHVSRRDTAGTTRATVSQGKKLKSHAHHDNDNCDDVDDTETKWKRTTRM